MPYVITETEYVTIDGVPLSTTGWHLLNLQVLWQGPDTRGQDRIIPGAAGVRPYPRRATVSRRTLELVIWGDMDWNGAATSDWRAGLQNNVDHLRDNVADPTVSGDGTRLIVMHMAAGGTRQARCHVEGLELADSNWFSVRAAMDLSLVSGALA